MNSRVRQLLMVVATAGCVAGCGQVAGLVPMAAEGTVSQCLTAVLTVAIAAAPADTVKSAAPVSGGVQPVAGVSPAGPVSAGRVLTTSAEQKPGPENPAARRLSAAEILKIIDLRTLPRLAETGRYTEGPTAIYYAARASVRAADAFYRAELEGQNWALVPSTATESPEYVDRLYTQNGLWLHVSIGAGGDEGTIGINLSVLGNMDLTLLPRAGNVEFQEGASPVNVSYRSPASIVELSKFCLEQLASVGWMAYQPFDAGPNEPPHVKTLTFLQDAACLRVLIHRDPRKPAEPALVAMFSEQTLPFDLPLCAGTTGIRLDVQNGRAEFLAPIPLSDVPQFISDAATRYGWDPHPSGMQMSGEALSGRIQDGPQSGFTLRVSNKAGKSLFEYQRLTLKDPQVAISDPADSEDSPEAEAPDDSPSPPADDEEQDDEIDREVAGALRDARRTIADELGKLGTQLKGLPGSDAFSRDLQKQLLGDDEDGDVDEDDSDPDAAPSTADADAVDGESDENSFLVPAKEGGPKDVVRAKIFYGDKTIEMKHILIYEAKKDGESSTVMYLSDRPLKLSALKSRKLGDLSLSDLSSDFDAQSMELRIGTEYTSINCHLEGGSISLGSGDIKSEIKSTGDRMTGRVLMEEAEDFFDKPFRIDVQFDARAARVEKRAAGAAGSDLILEVEDESPVPAGNNGTSRQSTAFRSSLTTSHAAAVGRIAGLYQAELPGLGWKEVPQNGPPADDVTRLLYRGEQGELTIRLSAEGAGTQIEVVRRDEAAAKKAGMVPPKGKVRIVLGNANDAAAVIELDGKPIKLAAHEGESDPATAKKVDVAPGKHKLVIKLTGSPPRKEEFTAAEGTTWGVVALPGGAGFVDQVY